MFKCNFQNGTNYTPRRFCGFGQLLPMTLPPDHIYVSS